MLGGYVVAGFSPRLHTRLQQRLVKYAITLNWTPCLFAPPLYPYYLAG